jgi:hypothetical protein
MQAHEDAMVDHAFPRYTSRTLVCGVDKEYMGCVFDKPLKMGAVCHVIGSVAL